MKRRLRGSPADRVFRNLPAPEGERAYLGVIEGKDASTLEEHFYVPLRASPGVTIIRFKTTHGGMMGMFGSIELDFLFKAGIWYAVQIDGDFVHKGAAARQHDWIQDRRLVDKLRGYGILKIIRIPEKYVKDWKTAEQTVREVLAGRTEFLV